MSGDVQPRKRKDKRRKKEGTSLGSIHEPVISQKYKRSESDDLKIFDVPDQGEKIHVQNEHGVGGNICVKIIFFCLFGLLVGAVGLIYMKSQGSTDVDLPTVEESRFAEYFTGWLDDSADDHEHEAHENYLDHDEHDENDEHDEHDDHEDHDDEDEDDHENDEEDQNPEQDPIFKLFGLQNDEADEVEENEIKSNEVLESESRRTHDVHDDEDDDEEEEEEEDNQEDEKEDTEEEDDKEDPAEEEEEEKEEDKNEVDDAEEDDEKENEDKEEDGDSGVYVNDEDNDEDDDDDDDDLSQMDEEDEDQYLRKSKEEHLARTKGKIKEEEEAEDDDNNDDVEDMDSEEKQLNTEEQLEEDSKNQKADDFDDSHEVEKEDDESEEKDSKTKTETDDLDVDEIEISEEDLGTEDDLKAEHHDEEDDNKSKKESFTDENLKSQNIKQLEIETEGDEEETEDAEGEEGGGVAIKLGVGIALIIVAHLVLVKKWKSMTNAPSDESVPTVEEAPAKEKKIENLQDEPVISRRQTLVPENITLNGVPDEEEEEEEEEEEVEDEEEEEDEEEGEEYAEDYPEEGEYKKTKDNDDWEKPTWNLRKDENEEDVDKEEEYEEENEEDVEELEDEQEQDEEEDDEEVDDDEEEYEEDIDDDVDDDNDVLKQKLLAEKRQEEVQETVPIPPPRSRLGRGGQEFDEESFDFQGVNEFEETTEESPKVIDEVTSHSLAEEEKTAEKKVGNEDDWAFRQEFSFAEEQFENNPKAALNAYNKIISKKPTVIKALIGRAKALDHWAEKEKSNAYLKQAINAYKSVLFDHGERLDDDTYVKLAERCIERMRFAGNFISAIDIHKALILKYPKTPKYRNTLAVTYLMLNKIPQARVLLNETLSLWPKNGFALVHYGFILKTSDNNMEEGAKKLMAGIETREEGVIDGMFFFHLGDALNRLGREKEAMKWYEIGVKEGLFLSKYQRSLYNVNRLKGQPWWTKEETTYQDFFKKLEENWREIRREGLELLNSKGINLFKEEAENLKDTGDWKQLDLYFRGRKQANCNKAPITCALVSSFKPASTCTRGQIKFSVMLPNTHVWPHCGPTNCRLRSHLGLVVPKKTFIRVAEETRSWEEGKFIIFDDSFEHEVWHNGTGLRLVLIVDVWHPELSNHERRVLSPI